jgi:hypothetical protein
VSGATCDGGCGLVTCIDPQPQSAHTCVIPSVSFVDCEVSYYELPSAQLFGFPTPSTCIFHFHDGTLGSCTVPANASSCTFADDPTKHHAIEDVAISPVPSPGIYAVEPQYPSTSYFQWDSSVGCTSANVLFRYQKVVDGG